MSKKKLLALHIAALLCHIVAIIAIVVGRFYIIFFGYLPIIFSTIYLCYKSYKKVDTVAEKQEKHP